MHSGIRPRAFGIRVEVMWRCSRPVEFDPVVVCDRLKFAEFTIGN